MIQKLLQRFIQLFRNAFRPNINPKTKTSDPHTAARSTSSTVSSAGTFIVMTRRTKHDPYMTELLGEVYFYARAFKDSWLLSQQGSEKYKKFWESDVARSRSRLEWVLALYRFERNAILNHSEPTENKGA